MVNILYNYIRNLEIVNKKGMQKHPFHLLKTRNIVVV